MDIPVLTQIDRFVFDLIFGLSGNWAPLDQFMILVTDYSPLVMGLILLIGIALVLIDIWKTSSVNQLPQPGWRSGLGKLMILAGALILLVALPVTVSDLFRDFIGRTRPFVALDLSPLVEEEVRASLPSNHATGSFAVAGFFLVYFKHWFRPVLALAVLISISRVYIGTHFPLDVVLGALLGLLPALIWAALAKKPHPYISSVSTSYGNFYNRRRF